MSQAKPKDTRTGRVYVAIAAHKAAIAGLEAAINALRKAEAEAEKKIGIEIEVPVLWNQSFLSADGSIKIKKFVNVKTAFQLDTVISSQRFPTEFAHYKSKLEAKEKAIKKLTRHAEKLVDTAGTADVKAHDFLVETVPTSREGLAAMIEYLAEALPS
jgi:hypothetical protein